MNKKSGILYHHHYINPKLYFDREKSWHQFNRRVLAQATNSKLPILERLRFCEIYVHNLDEYCMKRLGLMTDAFKNDTPFPCIDGKSPIEKILEIREIILSQYEELEKIFEKGICPILNENKIYLSKWSDLNVEQKKYLRKYFKKNIFPILTPLAVDSGHPFPFISNLAKNLGVCIRKPREKNKQFARIKIPTSIPQWIRVLPNNSNEHRFINIEEMIIHNLETLFNGIKIEGHCLFRITRNAEIDPEEEEEISDLMESIEEELRERKFAPIIRLEHEKNPNPWILSFLKEELHLLEENIYEFKCLPNYTNFKEIYLLPIPELRFAPFNPPTLPDLKEISDENIDILSLIRMKDQCVHHPYQNFNLTVERFIRESCMDPQVEAIKMTLYRTDHTGRLIEPLLYAAEKGKQVVCVVELKARFEEEKNIRWAQKLESAGIHVIYGILGAKTHSKMTLVIRREGNVMQSYSHISTGNYNPITARVYEDIGLFTANNSICQEVMEVFNHLTGKSLKEDYKQLLVAPFNMKARFISLIKNEIKNSKIGRPAEIIAKCNSLQDIDIINALYDASNAGVKIQLIVRGFCCLRPGVKNLSENIRVYPLVGRFLEHSRIYYFRNNAKEPEKGLMYIGSADWMYRNLENRVEVVTPILDKNVKNKIYNILSTVLSDRTNLWECDNEGNYQLTKRPIKILKKLKKHAFDAQLFSLKHYSKGKIS